MAITRQVITSIQRDGSDARERGRGQPVKRLWHDFYRVKNQPRADDQLVRTTAAALIGQAHAAESAYRCEHLPPDHPRAAFPPPGRSRRRKAWNGWRATSARCRPRPRRPAPANDRMTELYRQEADTLARLIERDKLLVGEAELLREAIAGVDGGMLLARAGELRAGMDRIAEALRERAEMLV